MYGRQALYSQVSGVYYISLSENFPELDCFLQQIQTPHLVTSVVDINHFDTYVPELACTNS